MKPINSFLLAGFACLALAVSALAQDSAGYNSGGPLALESQTESPSGQTDFQTDLFTGRFGYVIPFDLAPARHDSTPSLELTYNSANGNGWCGVGWDLDLGYIERETKYGVPVSWSGGHAQTKYDDSKGFRFSFKSKASDLVNIGSGAYRAQIQSDFLQFQFNTSANQWVVTDKSGNQYFFGSSSTSQMNNPKSGWSGYSGTFRWALDTIVTATGDTASITYTTIAGKLYPATYTYNGHTNGISQLYKVQFILTTANRADTTISCRSGYQVIQQRLLSAIVHTVNGQGVWSNVLNYTTSPSTQRSLLTSITRYGSDFSSTLPPITFNYSQQSYTFQPQVQWTNLFTPTNSEFSAYFGFANPFADLVDMDGDGLPARVLAPYKTPATNWWIQHNTGHGFSSPTIWTVGSQNYASNNTSSYLDWAEVGASHGRVIDLNGDGWPDFVTDPYESYFNAGYSNALRTNYSRQVVQLNNSTNLLSQFSWTNVIDQYFNPDGQTSDFRAVENGTYVLMLDMNGDGLPDRVMMEPGAPYNNYLVQFNTGAGFTSSNFFGPYASQGYSNDFNWAGLSGNVGSGVSSMRMFDINGDGLPDRVMLVHDTGSSGAAPAQNQTYLVVELNNGYGFEPPVNWTNVNPYYGLTCGGGTTPGIQDLGDDYQVAYRDINGDGLPDRIIACQCSSTPFTNWLVQVNTGTGFAPAINWAPKSQGQTANANFSGIQTSSDGTGVAILLDINGDGLPDRVEIPYNGTANSNFFFVELSSGPFPDLLTTASNGLGGAITATYAPSTQYDNRESTNTSPTRYLLPFVNYAVSSVSVSDGLYPAATTSYGYAGGYWSPSLRQFNGFAQTTVVDPLQKTNIHWFHQAGGRNNAAFGEFADSTNAIGKEGMEYRVDTIGSDGNPYHLTLNQVYETVLNGVEHFAYVTTNIEIDYPATSSTYKATAKQYFYDMNYGNLTNLTYWGAVNSVTIGNETFTDIPGDTVYQITQFASLSNPNIVDKPQTVTLSTNSTGTGILRQENYTYAGATGSLLQELELICSGSYRTNSYVYDGYNNKKWATNAAGVVTQITYDSTYETLPTQATVGGSFTTLAVYDPRSGKLIESTDPAGLVSSNAYDAFLRVVESDVSTTPNGPPSEWLTRYGYNLGLASGLSSNAVFVRKNDGVDSVNGLESLTYSDGLGRVVQTRQESEVSGFRVTDSVYDQRGNIDFVSEPYFSSGTNFTKPSGTEMGLLHGYDPVGRLTQVTAAENGTFSSGLLTGTSATGGDSTSSPIGSSSIAYNNGTDPWTMVVTDEASKTKRYSLDAYGRTNQVVEVVGGANFTTAYAYNLAGDLISVTDNATNQIQYAYNLMGELVAMADPDMGIWKFDRDYAGRLRTQVDGDNQTITNTYYPDPLGRLLSREIYDLHGNFAYGITNIYDTNNGDSSFPVYPGHLYKSIDDQGYTKYGYDVRGRKIITARYLSANGKTYTNQYSYDDMDRTRSVIYPNNGPSVTNIYDIGANLFKVQQIGGGGTVFYTATGFNALDQLTGINFGNGTATANAYYVNSHRLKTVTTSKSGATLQSLSYTYDQVSDLMGITDGVYSGAASASLTSLSYDDLHRLTSLTRPAISQTVTFGYNSIGNIMANGENGAAAYTYGIRLPHAVKNANGLNYAYDLCGNMLDRGGQQLVYDAENRLIAAFTNNLVTTFGYDGNGTRLWKQGPTNTLQVWIDGNYEEKDGRILYHISADDRQVCTFDSTDTNVFEYYHPDHLHSTAIQTDSNGNLIQHYEYSAYGQSRYTQSTTAFPVSRRYTAQVLDEETGLYFYGTRYYDPQLGRFIQPDSFIPNEFNPQSYDRYAYTRNNPLKYTDPTGHAPDDNDFAIPMTAGGARAMLAHEDPQAQSLMQWGSAAAKTTAAAARAAAEANPVVGTFDSTYQAATGKDAVDPSKNISTTDRVLSGVQAGLNVAGAIGGIVEGVAGEAAETGGEAAGATAGEATAARGKPFTQAQKKAILQTNRDKNGGQLASDLSGEPLVPAEKSQAGVSPPANEAQVDHVIPKSKGGQNTSENAQVLSRKENRAKSDKLPPQPQPPPPNTPTPPP